MKTRFKSYLSGTVAVAALVTGLFSANVLAEGNKEEYNLWVCGVRVTSENKDNIVNDEYNANKVKFDPSSLTLSLDGARLSGYYENGLIYNDYEGLTITGKAYLSNEHVYSCAINSSEGLDFKNADITIGRANRAITTVEELNIIDSKMTMKEIEECGISSRSDITISGQDTNVDITSKGSSIEGPYVEINDGANVSISSGDVAIYCDDITIDNATVSVTESSHGILAEDSVLVSGKNSKVDINSYCTGINGKVVTISAGKTTIDATLEEPDGFEFEHFRSGINATRSIFISYPDTVVEVKSKGCGIGSDNYLKIENSKVKAYGEISAIASEVSLFIIGDKTEIIADCEQTNENVGSAIVSGDSLTIQGNLSIESPKGGSVIKDENDYCFFVESDKQTTAQHIVIKAHKITLVPATDPTFDKPGNIEHYRCDGCGELYADPEGTIPLDKDSVIIPKLIPTATPTSAATATPTAAPTSKPTSTPTAVPSSEPTKAATPTAEPTPTPTVPADSKAQIMEFVKRIYIYVLDREPEEDGAAFWSDELWNFRRTGAEVAQGFIFSPEFEARNTTDEQFVTILYKTFFGRDPEAEGIAFWLDQLSTGTMDRVTVANGFIYSQEWADTCAEYGIRSGGDLKPTGAIAPTEQTYAFVERMYTTAMARGYDEEGKQYWASELANFNVTGEQVGAFFFLSDEMASYKLDDKEFVNRLYKTFMDRESDSDGEAYWLGVMASGTPRTDIVMGFTRSPEFTEKCVEARILPY